MTASTIAAMIMSAVIAMAPADLRQKGLHMAADAAEEAAAIDETAVSTYYRSYIITDYYFRRFRPAER